MNDERIEKTLRLLDLHYDSFYAVESFATATGHPVPTDTRGWSQVIVSVLSDVRGLERKKGPDLQDGSDVKSAITWEAIDTPRFNGVIKAGTLASASGQLASLDGMPHLYLVLWDRTSRGTSRCRIWVVRPQDDDEFRAMCADWYSKRTSKEIKSDNFQLHPPRGQDTDLIRNTCGNFLYPLWFAAERELGSKYVKTTFSPDVLVNGLCTKPVK